MLVIFFYMIHYSFTNRPVSPGFFFEPPPHCHRSRRQKLMIQPHHKHTQPYHINYFMSPGPVARLTEEQEVPGSIHGPAHTFVEKRS